MSAEERQLLCLVARTLAETILESETGDVVGNTKRAQSLCRQAGIVQRSAAEERKKK